MSESIIKLKISEIEPPAIMVREELNDVDELAASIKRSGLLQPIVVRRLESGKYRLVCGYRRYLACQKLGWEEIPARVIECDDVTEKILLLTENIQRRDVNPFQLAKVIIDLVDNHGLSITEVAERLGKSKSYVSKLYSLKRLDPAVFEKGLKGKLDHEVGYRLSQIEDKGKQVYYANRIIEERMPRSIALEWIDTMQSVEPIYESLHEGVRVTEEGEYVREGEELAEEEVTEAPPTARVQMYRCIVCGHERPADLVTLYNPVCKICLSHCALCGEEVDRVALVPMCRDCLSTLMRELQSIAEEESKGEPEGERSE